jgi:hypothetical protein
MLTVKGRPTDGLVFETNLTPAQVDHRPVSQKHRGRFPYTSNRIAHVAPILVIF